MGWRDATFQGETWLLYICSYSNLFSVQHVTVMKTLPAKSRLLTLNTFSRSTV